MARAPRIVTLAASLREGSFNRWLVRVASDGLAAAGAEVPRLDLRDYPLPSYDADLEKWDGLFHARWTLQICGMIVIPQQKALSKAATAFDGSGNLVDPKEREAVDAVAKALVEIATTLAR